MIACQTLTSRENRLLSIGLQAKHLFDSKAAPTKEQNAFHAVEKDESSPATAHQGQVELDGAVQVPVSFRWQMRDSDATIHAQQHSPALR